VAVCIDISPQSPAASTEADIEQDEVISHLDVCLNRVAAADAWSLRFPEHGVRFESGETQPFTRHV
jgi:hypothetical protein